MHNHEAKKAVFIVFPIAFFLANFVVKLVRHESNVLSILVDSVVLVLIYYVLMLIIWLMNHRKQ